MFIITISIIVTVIISLPIIGLYNLFCNIEEFSEGDLVVSSNVFFIISFIQTIACIYMIAYGSKLIIELLEVI